MAGARQVLELPELLENIISRLPAHQIYYSKRVAKFWDQLIRSSPAIRKASCLQPSCSTPHGTPKCSYTAQSSIELHPCIKGSWSFTKGDTTYTRFRVDEYYVEAIQNFRDEFATAPRCQATLMEAYHPYPWNPLTRLMGCVLYVKGGVKMEDLLDLRDGMITTFERFDPQDEESDSLDYKIKILVTLAAQSQASN